jgi:hypothetical protein
LEDSGPAEITAEPFNLINQVLAYQSGGEDHQSSPAEGETDPAQDAPEEVEPGEKRGR